MSDELTIENLAAQIAHADQPEQPQAEDSDPAAEEAAQEGVQDEAQETEAKAEEEAQTEQPAEDSDRIVKWTTASGETLQVPESELRNGYLRQQDYTRKTQEAAEVARQANLQAQQQVATAQALTAELGEYQALQKQIAQYANVDWAALQAQDPLTANSLKTQMLDLKDRAREVAAAAQAKQQALQQHQEQSFNQQVQRSEQHLAEKIPGITREEVGRVVARMQKLGASANEIHFARSMPWLIESQVYANRWLELQGKKPSVENKVRSLPPAATKARPAAPSNKQAEVMKAINSRAAISTNDFAQLLKATRT